MYIQSVWVAVVICLCLHTSGASICVPNSKFKMDCNICTCNSDGWQYSCSNYICTPIPYEKRYHVHHTEDGRVILKPKEETLVFDDNNKFVTNPQNSIFKKIPYMNDEIPVNEPVVVDIDSAGYNVKLGRKIPIVDAKFDNVDERFDFAEDNENNREENDRFESDDELDQNEYYENGPRNKIVQ